MIDWNSVVGQLSNLPGKEITAEPDKWNPDNPEYKKIYDLWLENKLSLHTMKWINYYPGLDFSQDIVDQFAREVNLTCARAWISKVPPGYYVAYHWDIDDSLDEYEKLGKLTRYSCFVTASLPGQIFVVGTTPFFNQTQGTMFKWSNYKDWHASTNCGLGDKYIFHFLGY